MIYNTHLWNLVLIETTITSGGVFYINRGRGNFFLIYVNYEYIL